jgi:hypothetical protein
MDKVDSTENVAEALETNLNISAGTAGAVVVSSTHEDLTTTIDVEVEFPHLNDLKDLYVLAYPQLFSVIVFSSLTYLKNIFCEFFKNKAQD